MSVTAQHAIIVSVGMVPAVAAAATAASNCSGKHVMLYPASSLNSSKQATKSCFIVD
jgi:hypothetical protein